MISSTKFYLPQADTVCSADYGTTSDNRVNHRNGYRHRVLDTRGRHRRCGYLETTPRFLLF
ncbi:transposase-like protein [Corynebacterium diphtheriae HC01]|nr:transposase-like protein [Corynebacterium diphtheriae 241]AEX70735.1 transposase-like protein [Corynebacterium diphtheriae PW8]AEX75265.1 transposase-like protein [Corynebacterium diphtheriae HC01]